MLIKSIYYVRPMLGPAVCRFWPSCSVYAIQQLRHISLKKALYRIIKRLLLCNPLTPQCIIEYYNL